MKTHGFVFASAWVAAEGSQEAVPESECKLNLNLVLIIQGASRIPPGRVVSLRFVGRGTKDRIALNFALARGDPWVLKRMWRAPLRWSQSNVANTGIDLVLGRVVEAFRRDEFLPLGAQKGTC